MEEYEQLKPMVQIEIEKKSFEMFDFGNRPYDWVKELIPITSRKRQSLYMNKL